jgi:uncharacterized protein YndB with AHSA1/START domain
MLTTLVIIAVLIVLAILALAATKPNTFSLRREAVVGAPPEKLFRLINDFHEWPKWSPWEKLDPNLKRIHSGAGNGKGAVYAWEGNKKVGQGRMEIVESSANAIKIKLDFLKPFEAHNITDFTLEPRNGATHVTWEMRGPMPFMMKIMHVFMNMDKMVGKDFEAGLANLKAAAES